ncbi:MAG: hypothetical protein PHD81_03640 [Candidatus Nanoarchaeia archaeon]|nr:hypothetical protein [Candidatus Nanoarchaeia archaeon]MDD5588176.1 hypothetical protein [Candidatus Nanoarchaeia archaeon]
MNNREILRQMLGGPENLDETIKYLLNPDFKLAHLNNLPHFLERAKDLATKELFGQDIEYFMAYYKLQAEVLRNFHPDKEITELTRLKYN